MSDIIDLLRSQAQEIADEGHDGWGNTMIEAAATIARITEELAEAKRKYEKSYDCHGMMCGACISCCIEMIHDTSAKNTILYDDLAAARKTIERVREWAANRRPPLEDLEALLTEEK